MPSPGGQFLSDEFGDIEDYFISDYQLIDQYIGDQLWGFGRNDSGQTGTNNIGGAPPKSTPVTTFAGGTNWKYISITGGTSSAVKTDGTLWTWGTNQYSQLGINNTIDRFTPVTTFLGGTNWRFSHVGGRITYGIKTDGTLWVWGQNSKGELGINNTIMRSTPVTTFAGGNNWKSVVGGDFFALAIKTDGTLWTWGDNVNGQLGTNDTINRSTPVTTFAGGTNWKSTRGGEFHTTAIKTDGTLWTWGSNVNGQLGINNTINRSTPVTTFLGGSYWKVVGGGFGHTTVIKTDGTLWVWGKNTFGHLGINNIVNISTPVTTSSGGTNWKSVSGGTDHTAAIKTDGTLWTWGSNAFAQLGINNTANRSIPVTTFAGQTNWKSVAAGYRHTIVINSGLNVDFS